MPTRSTEVPMLEQAFAIAPSKDGDEPWAWLMLFRALKIALGGAMVLGTLGGIATAAGWNVAGRLFLDADQPPALQAYTLRLESWPGDRRRPLPVPSLLGSLRQAPADPVTTVPFLFVGPMLAVLNPELSWNAWGYFAFGFVWLILVWALFGGAITRRAALRFTWEKKIDPIPALVFAHGRIGSHVGAMLAPVLAIVTIAAPAILLALLMRTSWGAAVGGVLWFGVIGIALFASVLALGLGLGWPLIWGTLAVEDSDAFDAMSRAYSYVFQGAARYACYTLVAALVGIVGWLLVWAGTELILALTHWMALLGMGQERLTALTAGDPSQLSSLDRFAANSIFFWTAMVRSLASGFGYAYFWTAFAAIYLLLRHDVESTPLDEISGIELEAAPE